MEMKQNEAIEILKTAYNNIQDEKLKTALDIAIKKLDTEKAYHDYLDMNKRHDTFWEYISHVPKDKWNKPAKVLIDDGMGYCAGNPADIIDMYYDSDSDTIRIWI